MPITTDHPVTLAPLPAPDVRWVSQSRVPSATSVHLPALDGLRGVAILAVIVFHATHFTPVGPAEKAVRLATQFGWAGVDLFFVLSGFLLTRILLSTRGAANYYQVFYARRVLRILPLYYLYCAALFLLAPALLGLRGGNVIPLSAAPWYLTFLLNVRIAVMGGWTPATVTGTAMFWSLCVEEQFYFVWPWIVRRLDTGMLERLCLAVAVVALACRVLLAMKANLFAAYVLLPARMDALAAGAWVALRLRRADGVQTIVRWAPIALGAFAAALVLIVVKAGYAGWDAPVMATAGLTCTSIASAALLALVVVSGPHGRLHRACSATWLRTCGKHAYALYLLSWVAETLVASTILPTLVPERLAGSAFPGFVYRLLLVFSVQFLCAFAAWHLVERRALGLKRFFPYSDAGTAGPAMRGSAPWLGSTMGAGAKSSTAN